MVAMEALQERQTLSELCKKHNLHPNQISSWKRQLKENSASVFKEIQAGKDDRDRLIGDDESNPLVRISRDGHPHSSLDYKQPSKLYYKNAA